MNPTLTICGSCEQNALRTPKRGQAMTQALACLTQLLLQRKRLEGMTITREDCLLNCPLGKICVALRLGDRETRHHLSPQDDLQAVARKLATLPKAKTTP
jgi:predicted metal-binding protein